ncbi:hypothetical protein [Noviherbaspirillum aerium]|uniref:hypothetical protein n=1 Tax=Noviherbaspirillum aerium TaxID=2588497 RepID=UPI00124C8B8A|nr:hypothetical protein [Noviherbaspirillum aerium]
MDRNELYVILKREKISGSHYSLDGGSPSEKLCLDFENGRWIVYYSERGVKTGIEYFADEDSACRYLLDAIRASLKGGY